MVRSLFSNAARPFLYLALVVFSAVMIRRDADWLEAGRKYVEISHTELLQEAYILLTSLVFLFIGKRFEPLRPVAFLLSGFFVVVLIREMDAYLDVIFHGAWLPVALAAMVITLRVTYRQRDDFVQSLECFTSTTAFGYFVSGGLCVFVFSRLFGSKALWSAVFQAETLESFSPSRWVKNAVEEGSELFGYCLILCASIELLTYAIRHYGSRNPT